MMGETEDFVSRPKKHCSPRKCTEQDAIQSAKRLINQKKSQWLENR
jgi:hypothetical protein